MKWSEFKDYLIGITPETPLGRIVAIRAENNPDILKNFTKEQRHIRNEWRNRKAKAVTQAEMDNYLNMMKNYFIGLSGG